MMVATDSWTRWILRAVRSAHPKKSGARRPPDCRSGLRSPCEMEVQKTQELGRAGVALPAIAVIGEQAVRHLPNRSRKLWILCNQPPRALDQLFVAFRPEQDRALVPRLLLQSRPFLARRPGGQSIGDGYDLRVRADLLAHCLQRRRARRYAPPEPRPTARNCRSGPPRCPASG